MNKFSKTKTTIIFLTVFFGILGFAKDSWATNWYVAYETGTDTGRSYGTKNEPRKTIPSSLSAGDVVYLKLGEIYGASYTFSSSGSLKRKATDGSHTAGSTIFTSASSNFTTSGITTSDYIFINGEGWFGISSVSATTIILNSPTKHTASNVGFIIANWITLTIDETWGSGNAIVGGTIVANNYVRIDGVTPYKLEIDPSSSYGVYATGGKEGVILRNLYIHDNNADNAGIYFGAGGYHLVQYVKIRNIGVPGTSNTGPDGITLVSGVNYSTLMNLDILYTADDGIHFAGCNKVYLQNSTVGYAGKSNGVQSGNNHPDGIAMHSSTPQEKWIRYNFFYNSRSPTDVGNNVITHVWFNIFYNDGLNKYDNGQTVGNIGWRTGASNQYGEWINNIFAYNWLNAMKWYSGCTNPDAQRIYYNNIFWENDAEASGTQGNDEEINVGSGCAGAGSYLKNNMFVRKVFTIPNDYFINWLGTYYTLAQANNQSWGSGNIKCSAAGCDWSWQNPPVFVDENRATLDFRPYAANSPQINAGINISSILPAGTTDIMGNPVNLSSPPIGAYEYADGAPPDTTPPAPPTGVTVI